MIRVYMVAGSVLVQGSRLKASRRHRRDFSDLDV